MRTDGQTDMTKLTVALRDFATAPNKNELLAYINCAGTGSATFQLTNTSAHAQETQLLSRLACAFVSSLGSI